MNIPECSLTVVLNKTKHKMNIKNVDTFKLIIKEPRKCFEKLNYVIISDVVILMQLEKCVCCETVIQSTANGLCIFCVINPLR